MKIAGFTIERAQNAAPAADAGRPMAPFGELGAPGTPIFGGKLTQTDYNPDLQPPGCYGIYDKMRLSDGQVAAALAMIMLPILRAEWKVEPATDSVEDREIAEFCEADLRGMTTSFQATMRQILLHLPYGAMPFEPVWEVRDDGLVHLRKLAPRLPHSVTLDGWLVDEYGGFAGIKQGAMKASGYEIVAIPASKLVLFVNGLEGADFRGKSVLRPAYKHWYYKDNFYRIDAIANEKRTVGIDIGTIKAGAQNKDQLKETLERALMTFHAHEKNYFIEDEENYGYRLDTGGARGNANAIMASIEHHDWHILRSVNAEFIGMGTGSTGSRAMHRDKTSMFLMALEGTADNIADAMSAYLLRPWVSYNWRVEQYPHMRYSKLDTRDTAQLAAAVQQLVTAGALTPGEDTERELRGQLDLPDESRPYKDDPEPEVEPEDGPPDDEIADLRAKAKALGFRLRRAS